ncbi:MAG: hypothetical protein R3Y10_03560 [Ferrimonas sp.]
MSKRIAFAGLVLALNTPYSHANMLSDLAISAVIDGYYQHGDRALGLRSEGFGLAGTELSLSSNIDDLFYGKVTTVLTTHETATELELEEAFIQTLSLPYGFSVRAGRFLSDIGYLNAQHLHVDAFVDRPLVSRAMLGGHYFDDGLRLDWVAPSNLYWRVGAEVFTGKPLATSSEEEAPQSDVGVITAYSKWGGDLGDDHSWQLGLSYLHNRHGIGHLEVHEEAHEQSDDHASHNHQASLTGKQLYIADVVYKWAPDGNYKNRHLRLSAEYFHLADRFDEHEDDPTEEPAEHLDNGDQGWYAELVYQATSRWSMGVRYGELESRLGHEEMHEGEHEWHVEAANSTEWDAMIAWHNSHFSTVRLQYSQIDDGLFEREDDQVLSLQFIVALGAHGAHAF